MKWVCIFGHKWKRDSLIQGAYVGVQCERCKKLDRLVANPNLIDDVRRKQRWRPAA